MPAGDLRYSIGFYQRETISLGSPPIDYGQSEGDYPDEATFIVPANIIAKLGGEQVMAARLTGKSIVNVIVRQSTQTQQVTTDWRAKDERTGEILNIRSVIDPFSGTSKHGFYFEILCEKGVAT